MNTLVLFSETVGAKYRYDLSDISHVICDTALRLLGRTRMMEDEIDAYHPYIEVVFKSSRVPLYYDAKDWVINFE